MKLCMMDDNVSFVFLLPVFGALGVLFTDVPVAVGASL